MSSTVTLQARSGIQDQQWISLESPSAHGQDEQTMMLAFARAHSEILKGNLVEISLDLDELAAPTQDDIDEAKAFFIVDGH